ncbi:MAG: dTDP-4-dehydrorhamnose 3,5-epimerase [Nanobdellota archaeon]
MPFKFEDTAIPGVILVKPKIFEDYRGFFLEAYNKNEFKNAGIEEEFLQENHSKSNKGVIRGIHFQEGEYSQAKLLRCIRGEILDVAVDLRKDSKTFGKYVNQILSDKNKYLLYIPRGFGHGFASLSDNVEIIYKIDNFYYPNSERGIIWDDPTINIDWPFKNPILSEKDKNWKTLKEMLYLLKK